MLEFALAFGAFLAAHVVPAASGLRERAIRRFGRRVYMAAYSVISLLLLYWLLRSAQRAPYVELWPPAPWRHTVALLTMPFVFVLLGAGLARANPLSISMVKGGAVAQGVLAITRHPLLWAFLLWSAAHVLANGDLVAVILFGSLALFSLQGMVALDRRARRRLGIEEWKRQASSSSTVPFGAILAGRNRLSLGGRDLVGLALGLAGYLLMVAVGHEYLFGVTPYWG